MSQRFIRCPHCGIPHAIHDATCPTTGKPIERPRNMSVGRVPAANARPSSFPPPAGEIPRGTGRPAVASFAPAQSSSTKPTDRPARHPAHGSSRLRDLIGKTIGEKYVVRSVLGEGGMGTVFAAEHMTIGRAVAVKVLHPQQARKRDAVKRFHQEARAAGAIGHPNICEVYDLGTLDDGSPYLVMERLVGETLADRIASEGGLPFDDVIDILTQVLSGLVAAHEKRIVHRDIKPENIFLTKRVGCPPVAKLLDFGVSKMMSPLFPGEKEDDLDLTRTGMVMGTPYYMSPEQARGDRNLDARVDLYACGVIMYEALTGRRPFLAANYNALLLQILTTRPRPASELRPALPQSFDRVIEKAIARSREERYQSSDEFQRDLQTLRDRHAKPSAKLPVGGATDRSSSGPQGGSRADSIVAYKAPGLAPPPVRGTHAQALAAANVPPMREAFSSSVEIPIDFSPETPLSGAMASVAPAEPPAPVPAPPVTPPPAPPVAAPAAIAPRPGSSPSAAPRPGSSPSAVPRPATPPSVPPRPMPAPRPSPSVPPAFAPSGLAPPAALPLPPTAAGRSGSIPPQAPASSGVIRDTELDMEVPEAVRAYGLQIPIVALPEDDDDASDTIVNSLPPAGASRRSRPGRTAAPQSADDTVKMDIDPPFEDSLPAVRSPNRVKLP